MLLLPQAGHVSRSDPERFYLREISALDEFAAAHRAIDFHDIIAPALGSVPIGSARVTVPLACHRFYGNPAFAKMLQKQLPVVYRASYEFSQNERKLRTPTNRCDLCASKRQKP